MSRVAGVDPGTVSFDLCVLQDSVPVLTQTFPSSSGDRGAALLAALETHGPFALIYGPSGYGVPLRAAAEVTDRDLAEMVLVRADEGSADVGVGGMRSLLRALAQGGLPVVFGPGVIHLPTVPDHRKRNRIDLGTADKVCATACAIAEQAERRGVDPSDTSLLLLELGGAFSAALAVDGGAIVDGVGGSSGPPGMRAAGALDGELAYLLGAGLTKRTLFSGGAFASAPGADLVALWAAPEHAENRAVLLEGAVKAARGLAVSVPRPREIAVSGRLARVPALVEALRAALGDVAPVRALLPPGGSVAALGAALLADGLVGGRHSGLVDALALRASEGSVLDHVLVAGREQIRLG